MKELIDKLMSLDVKRATGDDYTGIALLFFLKENDVLISGQFSLDEFTVFIYRFYADNERLRKDHYNKMINNLFHYSPKDLSYYADTFLKTINVSTNLFIINGENYYLVNKFEADQIDDSNYDMLIMLMVCKYTPDIDVNYSSNLTKEEFENLGLRLKNRLLERTNYCFVCFSDDISDLKCVLLDENGNIYDIDNYWLLCKYHSELFANKRLIIKKNGYPYIDSQRQFSHIEINWLKKIRKYLPE